MLWHCFDKAGPRGVILQDAAQASDALRQRLICNCHAAPDIIHELILGHETTSVPHKQYQRVKIAAGDFQNHAISGQQPAFYIKRERPKAKAI
jgi:hypothetical protein